MLHGWFNIKVCLNLAFRLGVRNILLLALAIIVIMAGTKFGCLYSMDLLLRPVVVLAHNWRILTCGTYNTCKNRWNLLITPHAIYFQVPYYHGDWRRTEVACMMHVKSTRSCIVHEDGLRHRFKVIYTRFSLMQRRFPTLVHTFVHVPKWQGTRKNKITE